MIRRALLVMSRSDRMKRLVSTMPVSSGIVQSYVPGEETEDAVRATSELVDTGLAVTLDFLGEDTLDRAQADATVEAYTAVLGQLSAAGLTGSAEVSLKLTAIGLALGADGEKIALDNARRVAQTARNAGTMVTLDMEDHTTTDATLQVLDELRQDFPESGGVLQSYLRRTEADCRDLAYQGSRIRLCKGAYNEPETVAYQDRADVDKSYVRCMRVLMEGQGRPLLATHDPRLIEIGTELARRNGRGPGSFEFQMLYGIRPGEQRRLAGDGHTVRVYVPYGREWYGYLMRRLAERPANVAFFARSLISKK